LLFQKARHRRNVTASPVHETVTCAKFSDPGTLLVSMGQVTANIDGPRGCRTKIVIRVADARKMVEG
jgi:hypothetical protein